MINPFRVQNPERVYYSKRMENKIEIFKTADNQTQIEVKFDEETVWLNRNQLAILFNRDVKTLGKHITNVFAEKELDRNSTVANFATVQKEGERLIERQIEYFNLDVIISVGYRVKSQRGTQFRQWATQRLKDYLVKGAAINQKRLDELQKVVEIIQKVGVSESHQLSEAKGLLDILSKYTVLTPIKQE